MLCRAQVRPGLPGRRLDRVAQQGLRQGEPHLPVRPSRTLHTLQPSAAAAWCTCTPACGCGVPSPPVQHPAGAANLSTHLDLRLWAQAQTQRIPDRWWHSMQFGAEGAGQSSHGAAPAPVLEGAPTARVEPLAPPGGHGLTRTLCVLQRELPGRGPDQPAGEGRRCCVMPSWAMLSALQSLFPATLPGL